MGGVIVGGVVIVDGVVACGVIGIDDAIPLSGGVAP